MNSFLEKFVRSKLTAWVAIILPGFWPVWPFFVTEDAAALTDPLKYVLHHWGLVGCVLLAAVLTLSPLRVLFPQSAIARGLNRHRRLVGVAAFAYGLLHFVAHTRHVYDGTFETFTKEIFKPFQLVGLGALLILLVLTITSLNAVVRRMGSRAWKNLHRLAYVAAALAAWHQADARKVFPLQVIWIFGPVVVLQIARHWRERRAVGG